MPVTPMAPWQTRGACSDAAIFRLLKRSAERIVVSDSRPGSSEASTNWRRAESTSARSSDSSLITWESLCAAGGGSPPGLRLAAARTKARARSNASVAMPSHRCDQVMCETGTIVSGAIVEKGIARTCSTGNSARTTQPGEQVPRMPSGSHVPVGSMLICSRLVSTSTWSPGAAAGARPPRGEEVVGVLAVADGRALLLEAHDALGAGGHRGHRLAHVAAGAHLGGGRSDQALLVGQLAQVVLEPGRAVDVAHDRRHLDLVHREHHRARAAVTADLEAG